MAVSGRLRDSLFQEIAQCLMRQAEAKTASNVVDAIAALFGALPITWYAIDLLTAGDSRRRVASYRCPRGFAEFVEGLGFEKRPDGAYQGTFGASTLLLVKVADGATDRCLLSAVGVPKTSPLNDGPITGCLGALVRAGLARIMAFEAEARRRLILDSIVEQPRDAVALFDGRGALLERHSGSDDAAIHAMLRPPAAEGRRRASQPRLAPDGRLFDIDASWVVGSAPLQTKYCILRVRSRGGSASDRIAPWLQRYGLSKRESEVAELVFSGQTNQRIADALFISRDTVKTHCRHIFGKLGITRRTEFLAMMRGTELLSGPGRFAPETLER
jgi:DNA-binding CsgD family transcriptional regulator